MKFFIFALVIVSAQANTIGRGKIGWESQSQPALPSTYLESDGHIQVDASGGSISHNAANSTVIGDADKPANLFLATGTSAEILEDGQVSQIDIADGTTGDSYLSQNVDGQDSAIGAQSTVFLGSGTDVAVSNVGDSESYGAGEISASGGPWICINGTILSVPPIVTVGTNVCGGTG